MCGGPGGIQLGKQLHLGKQNQKEKKKSKSNRTIKTSIERSARKGYSEQVGFQASLESRQGGGVSDAFGESIPEGGGSNREGSVAPCAESGLGDLRARVGT